MHTGLLTVPLALTYSPWTSSKALHQYYTWNDCRDPRPNVCLSMPAHVFSLFPEVGGGTTGQAEKLHSRITPLLSQQTFRPPVCPSIHGHISPLCSWKWGVNSLESQQLCPHVSQLTHYACILSASQSLHTYFLSAPQGGGPVPGPAVSHVEGTSPGLLLQSSGCLSDTLSTHTIFLSTLLAGRSSPWPAIQALCQYFTWMDCQDPGLLSATLCPHSSSLCSLKGEGK